TRSNCFPYTTLFRSKIVDTTLEQEFNFIKAYFVIVERINNNYKKSFFEDNEDVKGEFFQTYTWPTFIEQFEVNHNKEPFVSLFRGLALLNYFNSNEDLKKYVSNFIKSNKQEHYWHYLKIILNFVQMGWKERDVNGFKPFVISESEETKKILDNFSLNVRDYNTK